MKRIVPILIVILLVFSMSACDKLGKIIDVLNETDAPSESPEVTETAEATEAPTEEATEAPTEEPTAEPAPDDSFCVVLEKNVPYAADIDGDGLEDSILVTQEVMDEWGDYECVLKIIRGCDPDNTFIYTVEYCFELNACVMDCYPDDDRLEVLISYGQDSDDWTSVGFRVTDDGSLIDDMEDWFCVTEEAMRGFTTETGFEIMDTTEIWGTKTIYGRMKITRRGFFLVSQDYLYPVDDPFIEYLKVTLKKPLDVEILNEDGILIGTDTVQAGDWFLPERTDNSSYVEIRLSDGRLARVDVEVRYWTEYSDDWGIYINGVKQDEYADIMYAD